MIKVTYLHHSGFLLETDHGQLLFDCWDVELPRLDPEKDVVVFVSHRHPDHFDPAIWKLAALHPHVFYVLSDDIWQNRVPDEHRGRVEFMDPGSVLELPECGGMKITAFRSTDEGVAFLVEVDGRVIFHAGDLNDWQWIGEPDPWNSDVHAAYEKELARIREMGFCPDIAMLVLDGRQEELYSLGIDEFMRTVGAGIVFPMHFWNDFGLIRRFKELPCTEEYRERIAEIREKGQVFVCP
ncbi:MAG: MBL fold metallo-hydrolase [Clostridiales bacterium]|nr:MBL fold metallo-hydrolase [Clostridiales bacterium]